MTVLKRWRKERYGSNTIATNPKSQTTNRDFPGRSLLCKQLTYYYVDIAAKFTHSLLKFTLQSTTLFCNSSRLRKFRNAVRLNNTTPLSQCSRPLTAPIFRHGQNQRLLRQKVEKGKICRIVATSFDMTLFGIVMFHCHPLNRRKRDIKLSTCDDSPPHPRVIKKTALWHLKIIFENECSFPPHS
jgi:hypothetical protein